MRTVVASVCQDWAIHKRRQKMFESAELDDAAVLFLRDDDRPAAIKHAQAIWPMFFGQVRQRAARRFDAGVKRQRQAHNYIR